MLQKSLLYTALIQALIATLGSLYASEVQQLTPCLLCWYQRILMYPLVIILTVGILRKDKHLPFYVLPMTILGMGISFYQYLLQRGVIAESLVTCREGISCANTTGQLWFGFVTIPLLSFIAFAIISGVVYISYRLK
jgi:disulfide bond formation protein DsbB